MTSLQRVDCPNCFALLEIDAGFAKQGPVPSGISTTGSGLVLRVRCAACLIDFSLDDAVAGANSSRLQDGMATQTRSLEVCLPTTSSLENVLLPAMTLFKRFAGRLLFVSLIVNLIWFAIIGWPANQVANAFSNFSSRVEFDPISLFGLMLGGVTLTMSVAPVSAYAMLVIARLCLLIARYGSGERDGYDDIVKSCGILASLKVPVPAILRLSGLFIGVAAIVMAMFVFTLIVVVTLSFFFEAKTALLIGVFGIGSLSIAVVFLMQWLLWPAVFLYADERAGFVDGLKTGASMAWCHRKLSLSLVTVYFILATIGSLIFYVGQVVTTPLAMMPLAIGYVKMTGGQRR